MGRPASITLEALEAKLTKLRGRWYRLAHHGHGAAGLQLEQLLGLQENNLSVPDWGEFEIKTTRRESATPITLLSKSPKRIGNITWRDFILRYGHTDDAGRLGLNCTVSGTGFNSRGWGLVLSADNQRIDFRYGDDVVAYQPTESLVRALAKKTPNMVLVAVESVLDGSSRRVRYLDAHLLADIREDSVTALVRTGHITFDWRMHLKPDNSVRNHGSVYRIKEHKLPLLFSIRRKLV
ncbi:MAG: hypothetical protein HXY34_12425 [Candidatus Thorarchaeota archaeon]|nr:hypothetical protein [Candidatus Thorarchaeota archaeon]